MNEGEWSTIQPEDEGKGDILKYERETDNMLPGGMTAGQNVTEGIRLKSFSEIVLYEVRRRAWVLDNYED